MKPRGPVPKALPTSGHELPNLKTKKQAAAYLCVGVSTLDHWIAAGTAPPFVRYVKNGPVYFRVVALDRFIEEHEQGNPSTVKDPSQRAAGGDEAAVQ